LIPGTMTMQQQGEATWAMAFLPAVFLVLVWEVDF